ncbi:uncharacterized protein Dwil_GK11894 [Drosophila willistoni]|uniref:DUF4777 domain-containing protein n=1 Tax=Drosophila willistoni TaxID=7260 RepID=B4NBG9_DROWI|nr:uncharacterized protein LOC6647151 [Drosophila willistoni]EDW81133.1 uncharacterized protein Dwil_GK11894 [Drosophila willistoni]
MYPTNLGKQNGALVLEVLKVLGRPATICEIAERVANIYKVPLDRIQPVVGDVLQSGVQHGFFSYYNRRYTVDKHTVDQLRSDIDEYATKILSMSRAGCNAAGCGGGGSVNGNSNLQIPQPSTLMLKLEKLDDSPPFQLNQNRSTGERRERTPSGDAPTMDAIRVELPL